MGKCLETLGMLHEWAMPQPQLNNIWFKVLQHAVPCSIPVLHAGPHLATICCTCTTAKQTRRPPSYTTSSPRKRQAFLGASMCSNSFHTVSCFLSRHAMRFPQISCCAMNWQSSALSLPKRAQGHRRELLPSWQ